MKVGIKPDAFLTMISEKHNLTYSDALFGYAIESFLKKIYESNFKEYLWLRKSASYGVENYRKRQEARLEFYYVASEKYIAPDKVVAGMAWSDALVKLLQENLLCGQTPGGMGYSLARVEEETDLCLSCSLQVTYKDMTIPLFVRIEKLLRKDCVPEKKALLPMENEAKELEIYVYSAESRLAESFFEIMKMLELITDMEAYERTNQILKTESVSGRHIMEMLTELLEQNPKVLREKRLDQLASYRDYTYMRKRWEQYEKRHNLNPEPWEEVMDRIYRFAEPIWKALCNKEIFFDDWMPGLSRFLG